MLTEPRLPATGQPTTRGEAARRPPLGRLLALAFAAVVIGAAGGRFVSFTDDASPAPAGPSPQNPAELAAELERRAESEPRNAAVRQELGSVYVQRALETGDPSFYGLADRAFDQAGRLAPDDPYTTLGRGTLALALHDFRRARYLARRAVRELPATAAALGVLVDAEVELGHYDRAAARLQDMLDLNPNLPALSRASYLLELHGDLEGAVRDMRQAVSAGSGSAYDLATVFALLGDLEFKRGNLDAAADAYARSDRAVPGSAAAVVGSARVLAARGEADVAIAGLRGLTSRHPQPATVLLLGDLLAAQGQYDEAAEEFAIVRALADLQRQEGQAVDLEMALFEADHGDPIRAVRLARRAHRERPDNVFAADALAWALHRAGHSHAALPHVRQALRLDTADPLLRFHAAAILAANGQTREARRELRAVVALTPHFAVRHQAEAGALATRLGVPPPPSWRSS